MNDPNPAQPLSPCTGVCRLNEAGDTCSGCGRTLAEIAAWGSLTPGGKHRVLEAIARRGNALEKDRARDQ